MIEQNEAAALRAVASRERAQDVTEDRKRRARGERLGRKKDTLEREMPEFDEDGNLVHADRVGGEEPEDDEDAPGCRKVFE